MRRKESQTQEVVAKALEPEETGNVDEWLSWD